MAALPHHGRYTYSPIVGRPDYSWPEGRRLALYLGVNHEVFAFGNGLGAELAPAKTDPDVMNFAWRDYGNRVGAWRFMEMFDRLELQTTALLNSAVIEQCPGLAEACRDRGDEIAAHGRTNAQAEGEQSEQEERDLIARTLEEFAAIGVRPRGWLGPWISESHRTPDLLEEAGFDYVLDWAHDDQPTRLRTRSGKGIWSVPYSQEVNDIPSIIARHQEASTFADMIADSIEQLLSECERRPLALGIALHPYIMGQPHRALHLDRILTRLREADDPRIWWTTAGAIARHVTDNTPDLPD
ncbi:MULTISPECIES: polysaccharide deacetylase family protein [unclassified Sphingomonas]|uniref:polysaccharide deacetylase family protein n=1 Tax=unclassified Sphingomonas TaxID=196159 RepID=UPI0006FC84A9|nr:MULTISPECIES: polysaccharide deacetylase family protein [unclassified Sphingomonas]KQM27376.1 polysaccharide deacetylase [Sphingomonas sp. Leaf9]KQM43713.1 polysaccharide deacetylase [Sphingomonas sp. Leaf11]